MKYYILKDKIPVEVPGAVSIWETDRCVARTSKNDVTINTVFLGIDHNFKKSGPPILFETMIFGGDKDGYQKRCSTWAQAKIMHQIAVELITKEKNRSEP